MLIRAYSNYLIVNSFGKAFAHVRNWLLTKKHMAHWIESWNWIKHWRILCENDTKRRIQLCVKIKKRCYTDLLHFSTRKHNLEIFFRSNHILTVELRRIFIYILFFQEKTLGDISFKLETKIMNFMSVFSKKKYNQFNSSVVNNMQYNLFAIFPLSVPFAEFGFVFIDFITYFRF
jgi:hypothetical protein